MKLLTRLTLLSFMSIVTLTGSSHVASDSAAAENSASRFNITALKQEATPESIQLQNVDSYEKAVFFLEQHCPTVSIEQIDGSVSRYNPFTTTIQLSNELDENNIGYIFAHELAHHYQYAGYYQDHKFAWVLHLWDETAEVQADHMAYIFYGDGVVGSYTDDVAKGVTKLRAADLIYQGREAGC